MARSKGRTISAGTAWQVVAGLFLLWSAIAAVVWLFGFDFTTEATHRQMKACGFARWVLPGGLGEAVGCVAWNLLPFYLIPGVALIYALRKTLGRD